MPSPFLQQIQILTETEIHKNQFQFRRSYKLKPKEWEIENKETKLTLIPKIRSEIFPMFWFTFLRPIVIVEVDLNK